MKLSVIIPCLNAQATLATQLGALATQQWSEPWELIISDNGSTDNSLEIAKKYKERFAVFRIIGASARKGASYARNAGVRSASAERLAFCDADDEVAPGWVASIGDALSRYDVVHGQFQFDKFNDSTMADHMAKQWKDGLYEGRFLPGGGTGNLGIRRWVHEAIGGFEERLPHSEDADYYWRLQLEGFELHYVPEAVVQARLGRVKPSLPYLYHRGRNGAASRCWLYKKYQHLGMLPPPTLKEYLIPWLEVFRRAAPAAMRSQETRVVWLQGLVEQTNFILGQVQGRITNLSKPYYPSKRMDSGNR
jgi:glycosyltransferase involved in cell wall biosynthesis